MRSVSRYIRRSIASFFSLFFLINTIAISVLFLFQVKISTDWSLGLMLSNLDKHLRLFSETVHLGYKEYEDHLTELIKKDLCIESVTISDFSHSNCFLENYEISGYKICWTKTGIIATKQLDYFGTEKTIRVDIPIRFVSSEVFGGLLAVFGFLLLFFSVLMCVLFRSFSKEIVDPIIWINRSLLENRRTSYCGDLREIERLVEAINYSRDKIWEHLTTRTIRMIAHDMKSPMDMTLKFLSRFESLNSEDREKYVKKNILNLRECAESTKDMIQDLQDIGFEPRLELRDMKASEIIYKLQASFEENVSFRCDVVDVEVRVDSTKILRVFENLIKNAVEATSGKKDGFITFSVSQYKTNLVFEVCNTGSSLSSEKLNAVFDEFYTSNKIGGRGLGLSIAKKFVESHGGSISCISNGYDSCGREVRRHLQNDYVMFVVSLKISQKYLK